MKQLYNKAIYDFNTPIKSYWEEVSHFDQSLFPKLVGDHSCDVCVIGGGFTGISTAYHIAKNYGGDVRLLEAGHFGFASSGRNAGFCCLPATKLSISQLIKKYGTLEEVCKEKGHEIPEDIDEIRNIFHNHPIGTNSLPQKNMANEEKLREFLQKERGFSDARMKRALDRLKSAGRLRDSGQTSIFDF